MNAKNKNLNQLLNKIETTSFRQLDYAKFFIWFLTDIQDNDDCLMSDIVECFKETSLSIPNQTILRRNLRKSKDVTVGHSYKSFRLHRNTLQKYRSEYKNLLPPTQSPEDIIENWDSINDTNNQKTLESGSKQGEKFLGKAMAYLKNKK